MSNYSQTTVFTPKDSLTTGDPDKTIFGAEIDPEFSAISTAIATKVDTADTGLEITSTTVRLSLVDLTAATPVSGDSFVFADASDSNNEKRVTLSNLAVAMKTLLEAQINHDNLVGFVSDEHVAHSGVSILAGNGLTGGGTIAASRTLNVAVGTGLSVTADAVALDTTNTRNVDHAGVSITAGDGLTGGGTIAATRDIDLGVGGSVSLTSTNAVTASSHTHALDPAGIVRTNGGAGGQITVSTSAASGAATNGDMWLQV